MLKTVSAHTFNKPDYELIIMHITKKLQEKKEKWRKILKALQLIDYLIEHGNKRVLKDMQDNVFLIRMLENFEFTEGMVNRGDPIKTNAKKLARKIQARSGEWKDPQYKNEVNFISKKGPRAANAIHKVRKRTRNQMRQSAIEKEQEDATADIIASQFGDNFLSLDFDEDEEAIKQEKAVKEQARKRKKKQVKSKEDKDLQEAIRQSKITFEKEKSTKPGNPGQRLETDPFGGFENQFSTSPANPKKVTFSKNTKEDTGFGNFADGFEAFNQKGSDESGVNNSDPFSNFGSSGLTTPNDDGNFFGNTDFGESNDQAADNFAFKFGDSDKKEQAVAEDTPANGNDEMDLMGEFSTLDLNAAPEPETQPQQTQQAQDNNGLDDINLLGLDSGAGNTATPQVHNPGMNLLNQQAGLNPNMNLSQAHFTTGMANMNVSNFASMNSVMQPGLNQFATAGAGMQMGMGMNSQAALMALQRQQQELLRQKMLIQQQQKIAQLQNLQSQSKLGTSNVISYNPVNNEPPKPQPVQKTPEDYLNIDLLG